MVHLSMSLKTLFAYTVKLTGLLKQNATVRVLSGDKLLAKMWRLSADLTYV